MSNTVKFEHARFYDAELNDTVKITPAEFIEEKHAGRIECTTMNCHASLSYVSAHDAVAANVDKGAHFRTNPHGEDHIKDCPLNPDPVLQVSRKMLDEIEDGKFILLNINFPCSYDKAKATLPAKRAREKMADIGGHYWPDWRKTYKGNYAPYAGSSAMRLADHATAFREALQKAARGFEEQRVVAYLHGLFPWSQFLTIDENKTRGRNAGLLTPTKIFEGLVGELRENGNNPKRLWRSTPAFRYKVRLLKSMRDSHRSSLLLNFRDSQGEIRNPLKVDGHDFKVQDIIDVSDPAIRTEIQAATDFSFVATPYIDPKSTQRALEEGQEYLHVHWPITSRSQLIL